MSLIGRIMRSIDGNYLGADSSGNLLTKANSLILGYDGPNPVTIANGVLGLSSVVGVQSPDNSVAISISSSNILQLVINQLIYGGALNVLPGTWTVAGLPDPTLYVGKIAIVVDSLNPKYGPVVSLGSSWAPLYNLTSGTLKISTTSPAPGASTGVAYSLQLTSTQGQGAVTYSLVTQLGSNTATVSSSGLLQITSPVAGDTAITVQAVDSSGADTQKVLLVTCAAAGTPAVTPTFSPVAGSYSSTQSVVITSSVGTTIYYTTNGSTPSLSSPSGASPLTVTVMASQTIKAIGSGGAFTQSPVGTAAYTINAIPNPQWANFAAGGGASLEYEGFPTFVDHVRASRGFTNGVTYITSHLTAAGYPDGTEGSVTNFLYTGKSTLLGKQPWFYNSNASTYRTFKCTLTSGNGAEVITSAGGCNITNVQRSGNTVTWDLTFDGTGGAVGVTISNITTAWTAYHCYIPDYPTGVGVGPGNAFTQDCVNLYKQFGGIRFMWWQNAWNNTSLSTAANRRTPANTVANQQWSQANSEGYPLEWAVDLCIAANCGGWFHIPANFQADYVTAVANYLRDNMPVGKPIYIEYVDEPWNDTGKARNQIQATANAAGVTYQASQFTGTITGGNQLSAATITGTINVNDKIFYAGSPSGLFIQSGSNPYTLSATVANVGPIAMTSNTLNNVYAYLAVPYHTIAGLFKTSFGSRYGTDLRMVLGVQQSQGSSQANKTILQSIALGYMPANGWASVATADYHHIAVAPYLFLKSPVNTWTVAQIEANLAGTDGSGNTQAANTAANANSKIETLSVQARHYGMISAICYEGGDWDMKAQSSSITNMAATVEDVGFTPILQTLQQNIANAGATMVAHYEVGGVSLTALSSGSPAVSATYDSLSYSNAAIIAGTAARLKGISPFFGGWTPAKNVVTSGGGFDARNWTDNTGTTYPTILGGGVGSFYGVAPPYNVQGLVPYNVNVPVAGTYSLRVRFTNVSSTAAHCDVSVNGAVVITGTSIVPGSASNALIILGNITLPAGPSSLILGRSGVINTSLTIGASANSGKDINFI